MSSLLVRGGTVFDGTGAPGRLADLRVDDGVITGIGAPGGSGEVVDATGCWVVPGFIDIHTHYDAEIELEPSLLESVRHGVTTVVLGSCGLGMATGRPVDLADMFCRVEGIPRATVLPLLERIKDWDDPAGYLDHLGRLALGPNVACLLGHSTIRAASMGIDRALSPVRPTAAELAKMEGFLGNALDAGYLGLSINTLPWDKMDGDEHRSRPTPSVFAQWSEYRRLAGMLRERGRVFQGVPNLATKVNIFLFAAESVGIFRKTLKTTVIALMDPKSDRVAPRVAAYLARFVNRWLRADFRFQALPNPFDLWTDGLEVPVMEEIGAGTRALHERDPAARAALLRDPAFRARFRKDWRGGLTGRAYHRDLRETRILDCPDPTLVGRSFADVARDRQRDALEVFLDLQAEFGDRLRWYTVVANDRPEVLAWILRSPDILVGFSDAGAHLRNMAYYNYGMRLLWRVLEESVMPLERAVHRLTGEPADWLGIGHLVGRLAEGRRADLVVIDPRGLTREVEEATEAPVPGFDALQRVVRRNDAAVRAVVIGGRLAWTPAGRAAAFGREPGFGRVLRAGSLADEIQAV